MGRKSEDRGRARLAGTEQTPEIPVCEGQGRERTLSRPQKPPRAQGSCAEGVSRDHWVDGVPSRAGKQPKRWSLAAGRSALAGGVGMQTPEGAGPSGEWAGPSGEWAVPGMPPWEETEVLYSVDHTELLPERAIAEAGPPWCCFRPHLADLSTQSAALSVLPPWGWGDGHSQGLNRGGRLIGDLRPPELQTEPTSYSLKYSKVHKTNRKRRTRWALVLTSGNQCTSRSNHVNGSAGGRGPGRKVWGGQFPLLLGSTEAGRAR